MKKSVQYLLIAALGLSMAACGKTKQIRGYMFDTELADAIQPGVDNKNSVNATMGSHTLLGTFDDNIWYYVSTEVKSRPLFFPEPLTRRVMAINFSDKGIVAKVDNYDLSTARKIAMVQEKTPTLGKSLNFFQQLFMNVGRFSGQAPVGGQGSGTPNGGGSGPNGS